MQKRSHGVLICHSCGSDFMLPSLRVTAPLGDLLIAMAVSCGISVLKADCVQDRAATNWEISISNGHLW